MTSAAEPESPAPDVKKRTTRGGTWMAVWSKSDGERCRVHIRPHTYRYAAVGGAGAKRAAPTEKPAKKRVVKRARPAAKSAEPAEIDDETLCSDEYISSKIWEVLEKANLEKVTGAMRLEWPGGVCATCSWNSIGTAQGLRALRSVSQKIDSAIKWRGR